MFDSTPRALASTFKLSAVLVLERDIMNIEWYLFKMLFDLYSRCMCFVRLRGVVFFWKLPLFVRNAGWPALGFAIAAVAMPAGVGSLPEVAGTHGCASVGIYLWEAAFQTPGVRVRLRKGKLCRG